MILGAALCPHPPLLLRELTGAEDAAAELRDACHAAVRHLTDLDPDVVAVVGADGPPVTPTSYAPTPVIMESVPERGVQGQPRPLSLLVGERLLADLGWDGRTTYTPVPPAARAEECRAVGRRLADAAERTALLVLGDGSARRGPKAPGYVDERSAAFDVAVLRALGDGDAEALARVDAGVADELLAAGRASWQVLAGALERLGPVAGDVLYADDPFGVMYVACTWIARSGTDSMITRRG